MPDYYHNLAKLTVYSVDDLTVLPSSKDKNGWFITTKVTITRADNYTKADGQMAFKTSTEPFEHYLQGETRAQAIEFFNSFKLPDHDAVPIEKAEYDKLISEYAAIIKANTSSA